MKAKNEVDHRWRHRVVCPHCGIVYEDSWEWEDSYGDMTCDECGGEFTYERHVSVDYSTEKKR